MNVETDFTGKILGNFKIVSRLGKGGMAVVYKAHEMSLNRFVALKVLSRRLSDDTSFIKRFQREAQAAAQLNHPNIVQIYAIGEEEGIHYFAMEYVKGKTLQEIIKEKGAMDVAEAVSIIKQTVEALAVAHEAGIVHRDIKPANIMIDSLGRVKVADFGIAQIAEAGTKLTREGFFMGTPEYISPEQCQGVKLDGRCDIYSLGVTFYEMLAGQTPFVADTPAGIVMQILEGKAPPLNERIPTVPAWVERIVEKMMSKDREARFQNAREVDAALGEKEGYGATPETTAIQRGRAEGVTASMAKAEEAPMPDEGTEEKARPGIRRKRAAIAAAVACGLVIVIAATYLYSAYGPRRETGVELTDKPAGMAGLTAASSSDAYIEDLRSEGGPAEANLTAKTAESGVSEPAARTSPPSQTSGMKAPGSGDSGALISQMAATPETAEPAAPRKPTRRDSSPQTSRWDDREALLHRQTLEPKSTKPAPPREPLPPPNSMFITTSGDYENVDMVNSLVESLFSKKGFKVIDQMYAPGDALSGMARYHGIATVKVVGSTTLQYYGRTTEQHTAVMTMKIVSVTDGAIAAGPATQSIKYTALNADEKLKEAAAALVSKLSRELK